MQRRLRYAALDHHDSIAAGRVHGVSQRSRNASVLRCGAAYDDVERLCVAFARRGHSFTDESFRVLVLWQHPSGKISHPSYAVRRASPHLCAGASPLHTSARAGAEENECRVTGRPKKRRATSNELVNLECWPWGFVVLLVFRRAACAPHSLLQG
jgi:hypothetical protein